VFYRKELEQEKHDEKIEQMLYRKEIGLKQSQNLK
jgi:hypothetical protein